MYEGHLDRQDIYAKQLRYASWMIHRSLVLEPLSIEKFWPIWGDKQRTHDKMVMTKEMWDEIKKAHNLN